MKQSAKFVLFGGETLPEPMVIYWNFITDTIGKAKQAMLDWEDGKFPEVPKYSKINLSPNDEDLEKIKLL